MPISFFLISAPLNLLDFRYINQKRGFSFYTCTFLKFVFVHHGMTNVFKKSSNKNFHNDVKGIVQQKKLSIQLKVNCLHKLLTFYFISPFPVYPFFNVYPFLIFFISFPPFFFLFHCSTIGLFLLLSDFPCFLYSIFLFHFTRAAASKFNFHVQNNLIKKCKNRGSNR